MKFAKGFISIPMVVGLVIMAIAIPVAGQLTLKNQDIRNRAAGNHPSNCTCKDGVFVNDGGACVASGERCSIPSIVIGKKCTLDAGCATYEKCVGGSCKTNSCVSDSQCGQGWCATNTGTCNYGPRPTTVGVCVCNGKNGGAGVFDGPGCAPSIKGRQCGGGAAIGSSCATNVDCSSGNCSGPAGAKKCGASLKTNGTGCINDADCASGNCKGIIGMKKCVAKVGLGVACLADIDCESGRCVIESATRLLKCYAQDPVGSACKLDSDCTSGTCTGIFPNRKCTPPTGKISNGQNCTYDSDCASKACVGNYPNRKCGITEQNRTNGSDCLINTVCASGICSLGKCVAKEVVKLPVGSTCKDSSECEGSGTSCYNGKCLKKAETTIAPSPVKNNLCGKVVCKTGYICRNAQCIRIYR